MNRRNSIGPEPTNLPTFTGRVTRSSSSAAQALSDLQANLLPPFASSTFRDRTPATTNTALQHNNNNNNRRPGLNSNTRRARAGSVPGSSVSGGSMSMNDFWANSSVETSPLSTTRKSHARKSRGSFSLNALNETSANAPQNLLTRLRNARNDALALHQYESASSLGSMVLDLSDDAKDAFWLAQAFFISGQFDRCEALMSKYQDYPECRYIVAQAALKRKDLDTAMIMLNGAEDLDTTEPFNVRLKSAIFYLRGFINHIKGIPDRAKSDYIQALTVNPRNFEALNSLLNGYMLTHDECTKLMKELPFHTLGPDAEFFRLFYRTRLQVDNWDQLKSDIGVLESKYFKPIRKESAQLLEGDAPNLSNVSNETYKSQKSQEQTQTTSNEEQDELRNMDLLYAEASFLYSKGKIDECLNITTNVLKHDPQNHHFLPLHISSLYQTKQNHKLWLLGHKLVQLDPFHSITWYAVGVHYLLEGKMSDARRYLEKSAKMDPKFAYAWLALGHAYLQDGENDSAIKAYGQAARLFRGTHLPSLYLGQIYIQQKDYDLALNYLTISQKLNPNDPAVYNEMGIVYYSQCNYTESIKMFTKALTMAKMDTSPGKTSLIEMCYLHLAHSKRKLKLFQESMDDYKETLNLNPSNSDAVTGLGMVFHALGDLKMAIEQYHISLSISPSSFTEELLASALEDYRDHALQDTFRLVQPHTATTNNDAMFSQGDEALREVTMRLPVVNAEVVVPSWLVKRVGELVEKDSYYRGTERVYQDTQEGGYNENTVEDEEEDMELD